MNVLSAGQEDVCRAVAMRKTNKFRDIGWRPPPAGNPIINGAVAWIDCVTEQLHDAGGHQIVVGRVLHLQEDAYLGRIYLLCRTIARGTRKGDSSPIPAKFQEHHIIEQ
ncbi:flavin reductase family protein [Actinomadura sp. LCR2-06]|uniref:Flavin reductase family protein n=1 Tax=Actinomadura violacea TaxID=2819934 RepID=A0ABS3S3C1_9ACTN|nr:flavin reductase family protein [Actinomadura violacea]